jgi:hypothetical protein
MKKIKVIIPYRHSWLIFGLGFTVIFTLLGIAVVMAIEGIGIFTALLSVFALVIAVGLWFLFHYGIFITEKRVLLIEQSEIKAIPYDEVRKIVVIFSENGVTALIKAARGREYIFSWGNLHMGGVWITRVGIRITSAFVEKSIQALCQCEKVVVRNDLKG